MNSPCKCNGSGFINDPELGNLICDCTFRKAGLGSRDDAPKIMISLDKWWELSDIMLCGTRQFNEEKSWQQWTTSGWRMMGDSLLRELLTVLEVEVKRNI